MKTASEITVHGKPEVSLFSCLCCPAWYLHNIDVHRQSI